MFFSKSATPPKSVTAGKLAGCVVFIGFMIVAISLGFVSLFGNVASEGFRDGVIQKFSYKGILWKSHEGELAAPGFNGSNAKKPGQSLGNTFAFSVTDLTVAKQLEDLPPESYVRLYYTEYRFSLPWQGDTTYIITKVVPVKHGSE